MTWHRTPYGYLSDDGEWFIERGGEWEGPRGGVDPTRHLWLIWRRADPATLDRTSAGAPYDPSTGGYARSFAETTGLDDDDRADVLFVDTHTEEGWLADAKTTVDLLRDERVAPGQGSGVVVTANLGITVRKTIVEQQDGGWFLTMDEDGTIHEYPTAERVARAIKRRDAAAVRRGVSTITVIEWREMPDGWQPPEAAS